MSADGRAVDPPVEAPPLMLESGFSMPTNIPPHTVFPPLAHRPLDARGVATDASMQANGAPSRAPEDQSYFDERPSVEEHEEPIPVPDVESEDERGGLSKPVTKRLNTAPTHGAIRRAPLSSMALGGAGRRATGGSQGNQNPYSYTFDPMSSSSESSSSEDEAPQRSKRKTRPGNTKSEKGDEKSEERRRQARRGHSYHRFKMGNENYSTKGRISKRDGRLNISVNETAHSGYIAKALGQSIKNHLTIPSGHAHDNDGHKLPFPASNAEPSKEERGHSLAGSTHSTASRPRLNIVIMVIGSRGDIQPFLKVGKILQHDYGHRVRIASHPTFRDFVQKENGLEFFSVGGDPSELMAFMVKNPGLIPSMQTIREGEIQKRRTAMGEMFDGFWRACINTTDDETDKHNLKMMGDRSPFIADAIIANPPSMAHVHIAEKLGIPLHMMFTFPYTPTQDFPHPVANIKPQKSNVDAHYVNFMSYPLVEMMTWQGLGDIVNKFREQTLGLEPVSSLWAPGALYRMKVPYTYMWSPSLVPKPKDWGPEIDLAGFVFLDLASSFKPDKELEDFLNAGDQPVYIGFGSIVVDDPNAFTDMIFKAVELAGVRALVNKGWGGLGSGDKDIPSNVFMLGNTPHDWLFPKVKAVVHHGGAGTTAIGLKCGKPTMIVPFFGDQPFWGAMVAEAKAGAHQCIPFKKLTAERLAEGIKQCLSEEARVNVQRIADSIAREGDGAANAVKSFHRSLPLAGRHSMRCSLLEDRVAVWQLRKSSLRLSALAAELLCEKGKIKWSDLKLLRHYEWNDFDGPGEPITGGMGAVTDSLFDIGQGVGMVPVRIAKHVKKHEEHQKRRQAAQKRRQERATKKTAAATQDKQVLEEPVADEAARTSFQRPQAAREETTATTASEISTMSASLPHHVANDLGWGVKKSGGALLTMPNDLHVAIAQGFHNAPRLWGDATVRKPVKITGFKSGLTAARKEFVYGVYDGWTGLITQPVGDWREATTMPAKIAGLGKGIGKGAGGFVMKNVNAVVAPPAYFGKGVVQYVKRRSEDPGSKSFIRRAHIIQGQHDSQALSTSDDGDGSKQQLKAVNERVDEGWSVYQQIWDQAHEAYGRVGGNIVGKYKVRKEIKRYDVNGALENVHTTKRTLRARREDNVETLFEKRRQEMREAEQPRVGAMEESKSPVGGEKEGQGDGERFTSRPHGADREAGEKEEKEVKERVGREEKEEEAGSEDTAVATPDEEGGGDLGKSSALKEAGMMHDARLSGQGGLSV